jgi:hypothetical protein
MAGTQWFEAQPEPPKVDVARLTELPLLAAAMPTVEETVENQLKALDNRVFGMLDKGTLTQEAALSFWIERKTFKRLVSKLNSRNFAAVGAGERLKPFLDK